MFLMFDIKLTCIVNCGPELLALFRVEVDYGRCQVSARVRLHYCYHLPGLAWYVLVPG